MKKCCLPDLRQDSNRLKMTTQTYRMATADDRGSLEGGLRAINLHPGLGDAVCDLKEATIQNRVPRLLPDQGMPASSVPATSVPVLSILAT